MDTFGEFYQTSDYAEFDQTLRSGGSFGLSLLDVRQDALEAVDPAIPEVPFVAGVAGGGSAEIDFGDGWKRHDLEPGFVDIQPPNQSCGFRIPALHLKIVFAPHERLKALLDEYNLTIEVLGAFSGQFRHSRTASGLIDAMWQTASTNDPASHLLLDGLWMQLIAGMVQDSQSRIPTGPSTPIGDHRLTRVLDYIEAHLDKPLCVDDLAEVACLSKTQFSRSFKAAMGRSPARYVLERRCARADDLLRNSTRPLDHIARACGFRNRSYFSTAFRRVTGRTAIETRTSCSTL